MRFVHSIKVLHSGSEDSRSKSTLLLTMLSVTTSLPGSGLPGQISNKNTALAMFAQGQMQDSHLADKKVYFNQLQANN